MENLSEQYTREALDALLTGAESSLFGEDGTATLTQMHSDYLDALAEYNATGDQEAALELENLVQTAEMMATMAYESSDQYKLVIETEEDLVDATRDLASVFTGWTEAYALEQSYTEGSLSSMFSGLTDFFTGFGSTTATDSTVYSDMTSNVPSNVAGRYADGLETVPYDDFPALLHEGEQVVPAREVRADSGGTSIVVSGNTFTIREEADVNKVAAELMRLAQLEQMAGVY